MSQTLRAQKEVCAGVLLPSDDADPKNFCSWVSLDPMSFFPPQVNPAALTGEDSPGGTLNVTVPLMITFVMFLASSLLLSLSPPSSNRFVCCPNKEMATSVLQWQTDVLSFTALQQKCYVFHPLLTLFTPVRLRLKNDMHVPLFVIFKWLMLYFGPRHLGFS